jgi:exopolyphosphatase / guanosine-5'-triphosphate,3'-diphosphate pyrophosphatase
MNLIKFAAVDIGSNAVRLLIMSIDPEKGIDSLNKELLIRVPLRLGKESFEVGKIPEDKQKQLIRLMKVFKHLMKLYEVSDYRACATAAIREARNRKNVIKKVFEETEISIDIIDGNEEALIIYDSHFLYHLKEQKNYLFVDVGGGSTEISLISNGEMVQYFSYKIGTVRILLNKVEEEEFVKLHNELSFLKERYAVSEIIASGGNIVKLNTLANVRKGRKLSLEALISINEKLKDLTIEQRMDVYKLKTDRADVITNAGDIYIDIAQTIGAEYFVVPKVGLIDGIIHLLFENWMKNQKLE